MNDSEFIEKSKKLVANYTINNSDEDDLVSILTLGDVYVVWECKTLQNLKALLGTHAHDGMYFEVTYNGDKNEFYFDAYKKLKNICYDGTHLKEVKEKTKQCKTQKPF